MEIAYTQELCVGCGQCIAVCGQHAHLNGGTRHIYNRSKCICCGICAKHCPSGALTAKGRAYTVDEVMDTVLRDMPFYQSSGGGLTLTGGESMAQPEFALALAKASVENDIRVCIETCGFCDTSHLLDIQPCCEMFLYDIKETDDRLHMEFTGVGTARILHNLFALDESGARLLLRCPVIPGCNAREEHFRAVARLANRLKHVEGIELEPYHILGIYKGRRFSREAAQQLPAKSMDRTEAEYFAEIIRRFTDVPVEVQ